ncbi:MAG: hypothetical protein Q9191_004862 [Dirinaria sp. TL-2023a]
MGLASVGGPSLDADPRFLAALRKSNQQEWQWQPPWSTPPAPEPPPPVNASVPEWLTGPYLEEQDKNTQPAIETSSDKGISFDQEFVEPAVEPAPTTVNGPDSMSLSGFLVELHSCKSFEDIVKLALDRPFATNPLRSHAAFRHLLKQNPPSNTILDFVENPELHSAEARNLQYLAATQLESIATNHGAADTFCRWISKQIAAGLLSHEELVSVLTSVTGFSNTEDWKSAYQSLYRKLFACIAESLSYDKNPQIRAFKSLLRKIPQVALSQTAQRLGLELLRSHTHLDLQNQESCLRAFLKHWDITQEASVLADKLGHQRMDEYLSLLGLLQIFPLKMIKNCLRDASKELLIYLLMLDNPGDTTLHPLRKLTELGLKPWQDFANNKAWQDLEHDLAQKDLKIVSNYMYVSHMGSRTMCIFVLKHWYTRAFLKTSTAYSSPLPSLLSKFKELDREKPHQKSFVNLLLAIGSLKCPFPLEFQRCLLGLLHALDMFGTISALLTYRESGLKFDLPVVIDEIHYHLAHGRKRIAYNIFQGTKTLSFEHVPELADIILANPNLRPRTALCYHLDRNRRLSRWRTTAHGRLPRPVSRVEMINRIALDYAKAEHLSPRQAYKWVHRCYVACKDERLPIRPEMTRALVLAGCGRYLRRWRWVNTARFSWILALVREVEGDEAADRLDHLVWQWRGKVLSHRLARKKREKALGLRHGDLLPPEPQPRWWLQKTPSGHQPSAKWRKEDGE